MDATLGGELPPATAAEHVTHMLSASKQRKSTQSFASRRSCCASTNGWAALKTEHQGSLHARVPLRATLSCTLLWIHVWAIESPPCALTWIFILVEEWIGVVVVCSAEKLQLF